MVPFLLFKDFFSLWLKSFRMQSCLKHLCEAEKGRKARNVPKKFLPTCSVPKKFCYPEKSEWSFGSFFLPFKGISYDNCVSHVKGVSKKENNTIPN
jgi:hypothetical protein